MHLLTALVAALGLSLSQAPGGKTEFMTSKDGTKIASDVAGSGPAVILLHGGGQNRQVWHRAGCVDRLAKEFTVITIDIRGNGDSAKPQEVSAYHFERINEDVLAVADAVKASRFVLWGCSYGANVGRYLASRSDRVSAMVYIGINFGAAVDENFMSYVKKMPAVPAWLEGEALVSTRRAVRYEVSDVVARREQQRERPEERRGLHVNTRRDEGTS
jgi:pimeloyl-ACP methyl ester carboxylesterase